MAITLEGNAGIPMLGSYGDGGGFGGGATGLILGLILGRGGLGYGANGTGVDAVNTQLSTIQNQISTSGLNSELDQLQSSLNAANIANLQGIANNALLYQNGNAAVQTSLANGNFTTLNSINGLGRDITASNTQALINTIQNFNAVNSNITNSANQIIAGQTALSSRMADCCCEIKGAIAADGSATRALINDLNVQNLRDQLNAANSKVSNNEQNQYLLSTILAHFKPTATAVV